MPCPTCDHTVQRLDDNRNYLRLWCPRCGTLVDQHGNYHENSVPTLVRRVCMLMQQIARMPDAAELQEFCRMIGLYEASMLPDDRPV